MKEKGLYKGLVGFCIIAFCIMALCMVSVMLFSVSVVKAEPQTEVIYEKLTYKGSGVEPDLKQYAEDYVFAGWYMEDGTPYTSTEELELSKEYQAKLVPEKVLSVKAQVSSNLIKDETENTAAIRFLTSVDSLDYKEVGFVITRNGKTYGPTGTNSNVVYRELWAVNGAIHENEPERSESFTPDQVFGTGVSKYFKTWTIGNIGNENYDVELTVKPYWITLDGTTVYGKESIKTVNLGRSWVYVSSNSTDNEEYGTKDHPYTSFSDTLNAVLLKKGKIVLLDDVTTEERILVNGGVDLTVESNEGEKNTIICALSEELDSIPSGDDAESYNAAICVRKDSTLTMNSVKISGGKNGIYSGGILNVNDVEILGAGRGMYLVTGSEAVINGLHIAGTTAEQGISIISAKVTASNVEIRDTAKIGFRVATAPGYSAVVSLVDSTISNVKEESGIYTNGTPELSLNGVTIERCPKGITSDGGTITVMKEKGVTITAPTAQGVLMRGEGAVLDGENLTITNAGSEGISMSAEATVNVDDVTIKNAGANSIYMTAGTLKGKGIKINETPKGNGVLADAGTIDVSNLEVVDSNNAGLRVRGACDAKVENLTITNSGAQGAFAEATAKLVVDGITINGTGSAAVRLMNNATMTIKNGTVTTNTYAVYTDATGELTLTRINITRQQGTETPLISVPNKASVLTIDGESEINGNNLPGRSVEVKGTLNFNGGKIINSKGPSVAATAANGGAIYLDGGTVNMNGGNVESNTLTGAGVVVVINGGTFNMNSGFISDNNVSEGAVCVLEGNFILNGGTISGNNATGSGGGIIVGVNNGTAGSFKMIKGTISGNEANAAGGVFIRKGSCDINGGEITGNTARTGNGGGLYVKAGLTVNIDGGTISGNTSPAQGGGVCLEGNTILNLISGSITGNTSKNGPDICSYTSDSGIYATCIVNVYKEFNFTEVEYKWVNVVNM